MSKGGPAGSPPRRAPPLVVGLLGGIASGKSRVAARLRRHGAALLDADALAHAALFDPAVVAALRARHGDAILASDGTPDRAALGRVVFGRPEQLAHLESLIHPRVRAQIDSAVERHLAARDVPAIVLDVPLLLEREELVRRCDLLLFVDASAADRDARAVAARGWAAGEVARREEHQRPLAEKLARADVVFRNDGAPEALDAAVESWLAANGGFDGLPRRTR